jgi:hypothetical protein
MIVEQDKPRFCALPSNAGLERIDASMVKRLAEQTTLNLWPGWVMEGRGLMNLIAFAKAVAAFEREQCAKTCHEIQMTRFAHDGDNEYHDVKAEGAKECWQAIRMRSNEK